MTLAVQMSEQRNIVLTEANDTESAKGSLSIFNTALMGKKSVVVYIVSCTRPSRPAAVRVYAHTIHHYLYRFIPFRMSQNR